MRQQRGIRVEITAQLGNDAATTIAQWIGCFGVVWNCKVAENKALYGAYKESCAQAGARPEGGTLPD